MKIKMGINMKEKTSDYHAIPADSSYTPNKTFDITTY